jgi:hypothetical protein
LAVHPNQKRPHAIAIAIAIAIDKLSTKGNVKTMAPTIKLKQTIHSHHIQLEPICKDALISWVTMVVEAHSREGAESIALAAMGSPKRWRVVKYGKATA